MYLKLLWADTVELIKDQHAQTPTGSIFDRVDIESWISVPKLWTPQMNEQMMSAALWAGIPEAQLVHEPEAAASAYLIQQANQSLHNLLPAQGLDVGVFVQSCLSWVFLTCTIVSQRCLDCRCWLWNY